MKPHYIITCLWGRAYCEQFVRYCLPTLGDSSPLLIACGLEEWAWLQPHLSSARWIKLPEEPNKYRRASLGFRLAIQYARRQNATVTIIPPDSALSGGAIPHLLKLHAQGYQLVLAPALRLSDSILHYLHPMPPRELATLALTHLHPEAISYRWNDPGFSIAPCAAWWPAPSGILLHCLIWAPLLLDLGAIPALDLSSLTTQTNDGSFLNDNARRLKRHLIRDSDELFFASWGPPGNTVYKHPLPLAMSKRQFAAAYWSSLFDPMKRILFLETCRWHSKDLTPAWAVVQNEAYNELTDYLRRSRLHRFLRPFLILLYHWHKALRPRPWREFLQLTRSYR